MIYVQAALFAYTVCTIIAIFLNLFYHKDSIMKKIALTLATALILSACSAGGNGLAGMGGNATQMGSNLFGMYVQNQCTTELQSRNEWRLAALAMTHAQQTEWENKICGCVGQEAPNQMTAADMTQLLSAEGRTKVIAEVGAKTVTACYKRLFTK